MTFHGFEVPWYEELALKYNNVEVRKCRWWMDNQGHRHRTTFVWDSYDHFPRVTDLDLDKKVGLM